VVQWNIKISQGIAALDLRKVVQYVTPSAVHITVKELLKLVQICQNYHK